MKGPLAVYGVKFKNLKEFTTTKKDRKRHVTRMPGESMRIDSVYDQHEGLLEPPTETRSKTPQLKGAAAVQQYPTTSVSSQGGFSQGAGSIEHASARTLPTQVSTTATKTKEETKQK
jgi:hypothetical protein